MTRINRSALTKNEIITEATKQFLEKGYTNTSISNVAKGLGMSQGNLTFHFPTKEHLLAVLVDIYCDFQWKSMEKEANDGLSSIMAICLELTAMASVSEEDEVMKDFFISAYSSPMCLDIIRRNDTKRAKDVFSVYQPDWTDEQFAQAEILVSGIEYATLMTVGDPVSLEMRIAGALQSILEIYGVPEEIQKNKLQKVFALNYNTIGKRVIVDFKKYVAEINDQAFRAIVKR